MDAMDQVLFERLMLDPYKAEQARIRWRTYLGDYGISSGGLSDQRLFELYVNIRAHVEAAVTARVDARPSAKRASTTSTLMHGRRKYTQTPLVRTRDLP